MVAGMAIGFYFCWQESLVCLIVSPILIVGNALEMKMSSGLTEENNEGQKDANLLCGDSIVNYRTVQSFGNTDLVVKKYKDFLLTGYTKAKRTHIAVGCAYGFA